MWVPAAGAGLQQNGDGYGICILFLFWDVLKGSGEKQLRNHQEFVILFTAVRSSSYVKAIASVVHDDMSQGLNPVSQCNW